MKKTTTLAILVPFYNEEAACQNYFDVMIPLLDTTNYKYEFICIDDGSKDNTRKILSENASKHQNIKLLFLSRNFGKEIAVSAGLHHTTADLNIIMDCDFQDPPELIIELLKKWEEEKKPVVLAKRKDRSTDSWFKRNTAKWFYKIIGSISNVPSLENIGDSRLITREVVEAFKELPETQRYLRGMFAWVGFDASIVEFVRQPRVAGETKYNFWKLWNLAIEAITSFSTFPLRMWSYLGGLVSLSSFIYAIYIVIKTMLFGDPVAGYPTMMVIILFLSGMQMIGLGIIGEYLGRTYIESKRRPIFVISKKVNFDASSS